MYNWQEIEELKKTIPQELHEMFNHYNHYVLKYLKLKHEKELLIYDMENVKAIQYDKVKVNYNKDQAQEVYYKQSEKLTQIDNELGIYKAYISSVKWLNEQIKEEKLKQDIYKAFMQECTELANEMGVKI